METTNKVIQEGSYHNGPASVITFLGQRPKNS